MSIRVLFLAGLLCVAGCGGGDENKVTVYPVTGKITIGGGAPLADASVSFAPRSQQPFAMGKTDSQGVYHLTTYDYQDGAAAGDFEVLITKTVAKAGDGAADTHNAMAAGGAPPSHDGKNGTPKDNQQSLVNEKYSKAPTGLNVTVSKDSENKFDFDLDP